ncbi:WD40 repeat domain-containing protein [Dactylosporangium sucinum]|uniref:WD40 repeat domain-containing protein n=1 Tax=Dactylosporangium sucinum TaxID=1424081 RepID=UPI00167D5F6C|nr:hypothetical protein [Dactylosporangium sucinum]
MSEQRLPSRRPQSARWLTEPAFLVRANRTWVEPLLDRADKEQERLAAAVYRASLDRHRYAPVEERRQLLALDAARYGDRDLSARILATEVAGVLTARWRIDWSTGSQVDHRLRHVLEQEIGVPLTYVGIVAKRGRPTAILTDHNHNVCGWDLVTGAKVAILFGHGRLLTDAFGVVDGRALAVVAERDYRLGVWDLDAGTRVVRLEGPTSVRFDAVAFVRFAGRTAVAAGDALVKLWDLETGARIPVPGFGVRYGSVKIVAFPTVGDRPLAVTSSVHADPPDDASVRLWDVTTGRPVGPPIPIAGQLRDAMTVAVADNRVLAIAKGFGPARTWDLTTGVELTADGGASTIDGTDATDGTGLLAFGRDGDWATTVWEAPRGRQVARIPTGRRYSVRGTRATVVDGRRLVVADGSPGGVWDLGVPRVGDPMTGHTSTVRALAVIQDAGNTLVVSGGDDTTVRFWDLDAGAAARHARVSLTYPVSALVAATRDGHAAVAAACAWDVVLVPVADPTAPMVSLVDRFSEDRNVTALAVGTVDGRTRLLAATEEPAVNAWELPDLADLPDVSTAPDVTVSTMTTTSTSTRTLLMTGNADNTVRVFDLATGEPLGPPLTGHPHPVTAMATAVLDGRTVVLTSGRDGTLRTWDPVAGEPIASFWASYYGVNAIATATIDGTSLAFTGSDDRRVRVWDLANRQQVEPDLCFPWPVHALATAPDGRLVVAYGNEIAVLRPT